MGWAKRTSKPIPSITSPTDSFESNDYSLGMNSFISNDKFPFNNNSSNLWRLAQNARVTTLGEYETRKGLDFHSAAVGETEDQTITSTTGAADQSFNNVTRLAQKFTAGVSGRLSKVEIRIKNDASANGTIMVEVYTDSSGSPGELLARSSIAASTPTSSYAYITARFSSAPTITSTSVYWIVVYVQSGGTGSYKWSSTSTATTALSSSDSGETWSSTSYALNFKQHYATSGSIKGLHRAYKSDGTSVTLIAHGTTLSSVDNSTGALTTVKSGLSSSATDYRFVTVNDVVYYVNGYDGLRKWNFTTESQISATNYSNLIIHKGLLFLVTKDDPNKIVFSNFADYETFTSTDFIYSPAPKSNPVTSLCSINGYLLIRNTDGCQILSGEDNATFRLDDAPDQKSTFTQESSTNDKNYQYFASDDGVYRSNGTTPQLMSEAIHNEYLNITNKEDIVMAVNKGRLYMWYPSEGSAVNDQCFVWNLNYNSGEKDMVESYDTRAYVARAFDAYQDDDSLLVASSLIGQVYWQELPSNDYSSLGDNIDFLLQTHYNTYKSPAVLKAIRYWKSRFAAQSGEYAISCEYAYDLRDNWQLVSSLSVQGSGETYGSGIEYGDGSVYGTTSETQANTYIPGEYRRIAVRFKHYAARQPHTFLGQTQVVQTRRLR